MLAFIPEAASREYPVTLRTSLTEGKVEFAW